MKQRGFGVVYLLIGVLILAALGGAYYFGKSQTPNSVVVSTTPQPITVPSPSPDETANPDLTGANWKTYTNTEGKYSLKYPQQWYFKTYEQQTQKGQAIFQNRPFDIAADEIWLAKDGFVNGEIKIMTANQIRGSDWVNISEEEFYNPNSKFWLQGSGIGGGPGFTQYTPIENQLAGKRVMMQRTHPDKPYEFVYPDQITNYFYVYLDDNTKDILIISFTYDQKQSDAENNLSVFNQILSTFKFTQ